MPEPKKWYTGSIYNYVWQPRCFEVDEWNDWRRAESLVPERKTKQTITSVCKDCTAEYQELMIEEERCGNPRNKRR